MGHDYTKQYLFSLSEIQFEVGILYLIWQRFVLLPSHAPFFP